MAERVMRIRLTNYRAGLLPPAAYGPGQQAGHCLKQNSKEQPCDLGTLAHFPDLGLGYFCRVGGSNEAKTATGSDALNSMDGVCGARFRVRRLPRGHLVIRRHSRFV